MGTNLLKFITLRNIAILVVFNFVVVLKYTSNLSGDLFFPKSKSHIPFAKDVIKNYSELESIYLQKLKEKVTPDNLKLIADANKNYHLKFPFPHTYVDDIFPKDVIDAVEKEIPDNPYVSSLGCVQGSQKCYKTKSTQYKKSAYDDERYFGPATLSLFRTLRSQIFIQFLEQLTGINDLIPDPEYRGSGIHQTLSGGYLKIHADFNRYEKYKMHRRVNVFVFLNRDWSPSYGGSLELWSKDLKSCGAKISPDWGRFVVFSSTDFSYHGHPNPIECPENRSRRSLALYYYTKTRPQEECLNQNCYSAHSTLFQNAQCNHCTDAQCIHL